MLRSILLTLCATGCLSTQSLGTSTPTRDICVLGVFDQTLAVAKDFRVDRVGDDTFPSDQTIRQTLAADATAVERTGKCAGEKPIGTFAMTVQRVEAGSSRSRGGKGLMFALLLPTLGLSSIYPFSEERWVTIELDAALQVAEQTVWTGSFTSHTRVKTLQKDLPKLGEELTALMKKAQVAAAGELAPLARAR